MSNQKYLIPKEFNDISIIEDFIDKLSNYNINGDFFLIISLRNEILKEIIGKEIKEIISIPIYHNNENRADLFFKITNKLFGIGNSVYNLMIKDRLIIPISDILPVIKKSLLYYNGNSFINQLELCDYEIFGFKNCNTFIIDEIYKTFNNVTKNTINSEYFKNSLKTILRLYDKQLSSVGFNTIIYQPIPLTKNKFFAFLLGTKINNQNDASKIKEIFWKIYKAINLELVPLFIEYIDNLQRNYAYRSAISSIMARNMSHNIGSHVLNYLSNPDYFENEEDFWLG